MDAFRKLVIFSLIAWLGLILALFSVGAVSYITILDPSFAGSRLEASGLYEDFADNAVEVLSSNLHGSAREVDQAMARLEPVFEEILTPGLVQSSAEKVLDGIAAWLDGKTDVPRFLIDTEDIRADLNAALIGHLETRLAALPICPAGIDLEQYDPFTADCRPPGNLDQLGIQLRANDFTSQMPLLGRKQIAGSDIVDDPTSDRWRTVPEAYFWGKVAVGVFFGLLVLISTLVLAVSSDRSKITRRLGHVTLFNALVLLVGGGVIALFLGGHGLNFIAEGEQERVAFAQEVVIPVLRSFAQGIGAWLVGFGAIFLFPSIVFYITSRWLKRHQAPTAALGTPTGAAPSKTTQQPSPQAPAQVATPPADRPPGSPPSERTSPLETPPEENAPPSR
jgi:hypothetical protein